MVSGTFLPRRRAVTPFRCPTAEASSGLSCGVFASNWARYEIKDSVEIDDDIDGVHLVSLRSIESTDATALKLLCERYDGKRRQRPSRFVCISPTSTILVVQLDTPEI
jgi:hypothetical protein